MELTGLDVIINQKYSFMSHSPIEAVNKTDAFGIKVNVACRYSGIEGDARQVVWIPINQIQ